MVEPNYMVVHRVARSDLEHAGVFHRVFSGIPWGIPSFTVFDVLKLLPKLKLSSGKIVPYEWLNDIEDDHLLRVARLCLVSKFRDNVQIDVGCPSLNHRITGLYEIEDGHHRLAASFIRQDTFIKVEFAGELDYVVELFPSARVTRHRKLPTLTSISKGKQDE